MMVDNSTNINKKGTITSQLNSLNIKKTTTNYIGNPGLGLGQAQACGRVKPVHGITMISQKPGYVGIHFIKRLIKTGENF